MAGKAILPALGVMDPADLPEAERVLLADDEPVLALRVRHVVTESQRVRDAEMAIAKSDWAEVGRLMTESGRSSATDYDISHPAVERIVVDLPGAVRRPGRPDDGRRARRISARVSCRGGDPGRSRDGLIATTSQNCREQPADQG